tara:strand:- start:194 stop:448 length:255 start_codon:yes stop_codon:yes gene_type:complete
VNDEVRKALDDMREWINDMALSLDMDDLEDGWEFDRTDIRETVMETSPDQMVQMLTGLASRIEEIDDKLKTLEHIPVVWPYGVT